MNKLSILGQACSDYFDYIKSDDYHEDKVGDYENDIFEKAMETCFGPNVFDGINAILRDKP